MKLSKPQIKAHNEAMRLVDLERRLTCDEKEFILENFHEGALHINSAAGAFFTPRGLARDFAIEVDGKRVIDLCAGIGALSYAVEHKVESLTCIEINPDYLRIGKKIVPDATWLNCSVFDAQVLALGLFDCAISNPPFGTIKGDDYRGAYKGSQFEYKVMEIASRLARYGAFILPATSANFEYSGKQCYREVESQKAKVFREQTGILMQPSCGIDTAIYQDDWRGVSPICEVVVCEFAQKPAEAVDSRQHDLFVDMKEAA
jgi:hypothetical protein